MIYLLWSVLNLAALGWFVFISFSVLKLIREHMGMGALVIFILGSFSFIKGTVTSEKPQIAFNQPATMGRHTVDEKLLYSISLLYAYPKDSLNGEAKGYVSQSGVVMGHAWKSASTLVYMKGGRLHYDIAGTREWKFLALTLYHQPQRFTGEIK